MDVHLKALAEAGLELSAAEEAVAAGEATAAAEGADRVEEQLAALRAGWATMGAAERTLVGRTAKPLADRLAALRRRLPRRSALSEVPVAERPAEEGDDDAAELAAP